VLSQDWKNGRWGERGWEEINGSTLLGEASKAFDTYSSWKKDKAIKFPPRAWRKLVNKSFVYAIFVEQGGERVGDDYLEFYDSGGSRVL